jgi:L-alanine-DL-glutamate epimerase-like enolase superfamily enzyme
MLASAVRIIAIAPALVDVPLRGSVQGVHGTTAVQRSVLVRVETEAGTEGWGKPVALKLYRVGL